MPTIIYSGVRSGPAAAYAEFSCLTHEPRPRFVACGRDEPEAVEPRKATLMTHAIVAALVLGAVNTAGDLLWAALSLRHRMAYGLVHGALICLCIGAFVGWRARRVALGATVGLVIGVVAAGLFYLLAPWLRYSAMFPAWMFFWICFAILQEGLRSGRAHAWGLAAARGLVAAILSGLAFYAISGIWTRPPRDPNYLYNFGAWAFAFLPGFAALFMSGAAERAVTPVDRAH